MATSCQFFRVRWGVIAESNRAISPINQLGSINQDSICTNRLAQFHFISSAQSAGNEDQVTWSTEMQTPKEARLWEMSRIALRAQWRACEKANSLSQAVLNHPNYPRSIITSDTYSRRSFDTDARIPPLHLTGICQLGKKPHQFHDYALIFRPKRCALVGKRSPSGVIKSIASTNQFRRTKNSKASWPSPFLQMCMKKVYHPEIHECFLHFFSGRSIIEIDIVILPRNMKTSP